MARVRRLLMSLVALVLLTACGADVAGVGTPVPALERLPTVTPIQPTAAVVQAATTTPLPTALPPTATPTTVPVVMSEDGPVTASMAQLELGGEQYAALGDPNAPITIVEFSDFGCPSCRVYSLMTFPELRTEYIDTGQVYYVYKDLPIVSPKGDLAAQAAECAGNQGQYWPMHQQLFFLNAADWNGSTEAALASFRTVAETIEIDAAALEQCVVTGQYEQDVASDFEEAQAIGLFGTPAFFINGKLLIGAQPFEVFDEVLQDELAGE